MTYVPCVYCAFDDFSPMDSECSMYQKELQNIMSACACVWTTNQTSGNAYRKIIRWSIDDVFWNG